MSMGFSCPVSLMTGQEKPIVFNIYFDGKVIYTCFFNYYSTFLIFSIKYFVM